MTWIIEALRKYAVFTGRSRRREYWGFLLFVALGVVAITVIDAAIATGDPSVGVLGTVFILAMILPSIAVSVRRLHDTGRSGWWYLISFIPFGGLVLLVFMLQDSQPGPNLYGPNPKERGVTRRATYGDV